MINKADKNGIKAGGVTVELLLAILLSVVVLFLILGLFSDNLKQMIVNSNISRVFANNSAKTTYSNQNPDPTQTQEEVQIVADHALDWYLKNAQDAIAGYLKIPPSMLVGAQLEDFAKQVTIAKIGNISIDYKKIDPYGINVSLPSGYGQCYTSINNQKFLIFNTASSKINFSIYQSNDEERLTLIKEVLRKNFG